MKLYISGKMTGLPNHNYPAFFKAEEQLIKKGYKTINPARLGFVEDWKWEDYMKRDIASMMNADGLVMLDGWENSKGARMEFNIAKDLNMPVYKLEELV